MGLLVDIAKVVLSNTADGDVSDSVSKGNSLRKSLMNNNAITKMAKDAIFNYPVIVSESVNAYNTELVTSICKYYESHYSVFTMIAMGLDPIMDKDSVMKNHIMKFYTAESNDDGDIDIVEEDSAANATIMKISDDAPNKSLKAKVNDDMVIYANGGTVDIDNKLSSEGGHRSAAAKAKAKRKFKERHKNTEPKNTEPKDTEPKDITPKNTESKDIAPKDIAPISNDNVFDSYKIKKLENRNRNADPTMIEISMKLANGTSVTTPIAIKSVLHIITSEESERIFEYLKTNRPIINFVRFVSGEIKLFRDIILQVGMAKKDKRLYAKLGRHPWFRRLISRKDKSTIKKLISFIPIINELVKENPAPVLPICSLVISKDELVTGMVSDWRSIKKSIDGLLQKMMLLSIAVVDTSSDTVEVVYYGFKDSNLMRVKNIVDGYSSAGKNKDKEKDISKLLQTLIYKV